MKSLNKFIAILFAAFGVQTLSAQDWTASNVGAGTYYIYNVGADQFLCSGNNWGSHASVAKGGIPLTLAASGNKYTISTASIYSGKYLSGDGWMDGGSHGWVFESVGNGVYKLKNGSNVLYWNGETSTNTTVGGDPGTTASQWKLVTEENRIAALSNATEEKPIDATFLIKNAYFAKGNGRIVAKDVDLTNSPSWKGTTLTDLWGYDSGNEDACYAVEQYGKSFDNYQELNVPNGKYFLTAKGFYRGDVIPYIYANSEKCNLKQKGDIGGDNIENGAKAMLGDAYLLDGVNVVVTDGKLRVGVKSDASIDWCVFDDFKLVYYGTPYNNALVKVNELIELCEKYADKTSEFNAALNNAKNEIEQASSVEAVKNVYFSLEIARQVFVNPQTWTGNEVSNGDYYLYNIGSKKFFAAGNSWGTQGSLKDNAILCTLSGSDGNFTVSTQSGWKDCYLGSNGYVDNGTAWTLTFTNVAENVYTISSGANYLGYDGSSSELALNITDDLTPNALWVLLNTESIYQDMSKATLESGMNLPLIKNANFDRNHELLWQSTGKEPTVGGENINNVVEIWGNSTFDVYQEFTGLPNGVYELTCQGFHRMGGGDNNAVLAAQNFGTGNEALTAMLYANGTQTPLKSIIESADLCQGGETTSYGSVPNGHAGISQWMTAGGYDANTVRVNVTDGKLRVGVKKETSKKNDWTGFDNFRLVYYGVDLSELQTNLSNKISEAQAICQGENVNDYVKDLLNAAISEAENATETEEGLTEAINELTTAINSAVGFRSLLAPVYDLIEQCNSYYTNSTAESKTAFKSAIDAAVSNIKSASTEDAVNRIYATLESACRTYITSGAVPAEGYPFELTFKVVNPTFDANVNDWNCNTEAQNSGRAENQGGAITGGFFENWGSNSYTGDMYQTITGLPVGMYEVKIAAFRDQLIDGASDTEAVYVFAGEQEVLVNSATPSYYTVSEVKVDNGELTIGLRSKVKKYKWMGLDNVTLKMTAGIDLSELKELIADNLTKAQTIEGKMSVDVQAQLTAAINNADANSYSQTKLEKMLDDLLKAIEAAKASISDYDNIKNYIEMTKVFTDVTTYETKYNNGEYNSEDVEPTRQELNVIRFDAATAVYKNKVEVTGWTGTMKTDQKGQHWDGTNSTTYYDANSWGDLEADALSTKIKLIKGTYVLKVAGRAHADATLTLEVLGQVINFHAKGDTGYGIDVDGNANFSADGTYANENAGRGWEWEFLKFTVDSDQEVELKVNSDYNNKWQVWTSFCDITLWMDDDTYVNVNGGAIDAPKAEAESIVNTLPMGEAENTALQNAIAACDTKAKNPAELNAQIEGLNTAVANANAWRTVYYAEKDKLVAQLERFETDYNNAENGSLEYMNKNRWATVIEKAQAVALAKDNQSSYEGFETAANELTEALDAATVSVNEYAALESAIDEANKLVAANVGDQPFEKPQSAADAINTTDEQTLYDAATADGEGVTSVTDALAEGITKFKDVPLNAPKEGQRFYIKVATEGHPKLGNAVLATLGATSANNPTGYGLNCNYAVNGNLTQKFTFTQVEGNIYNISIEKAEGTVYLTYGSLNGSAAGWKNQQIQATTDDANKGEFKIEATTKEGVLKILNTIDNNYLDCQGGGSIYTDTGIQSEEFNFELTSEEHKDTLTISSAKWSTLILPFNAELPEGVKAYTCAGVIDGVLEFNKATAIKANTPYLVGGNEGEYYFSGYGLADKDSYTEGLFTGTYVDYQTEADGKTWVLQKDKNTGSAVFLIVGTSVQPKVRANRCYITYEEVSGARMLRLGFGDDDTTGIDNMQFPTDNSGVTIYDTMGRKVTSMKKGNLYIMNGRKVVVK